jgi:hypothetical protein
MSGPNWTIVFHEVSTILVHLEEQWAQDNTAHKASEEATQRMTAQTVHEALPLLRDHLQSIQH